MTAATRPRQLTIPPPPALDLHPTRERALVTVVVGAETRACFETSGPLMRAYADRVGADLVVLEWPGHHAWPISAKFAIPTVLDHYERIAFVDADVLLRPGCMDLFEQCGPDEMGIFDELPWLRAAGNVSMQYDYRQLRAQMRFKPLGRVPWYGNTGVMVVPRSHRDVLLPPAGPMPTHHCAEQDHTNARLLDSGLSVRLLDRRCNWQFWTDPEFRAAPSDAILHWCGFNVDRAARPEQMRAFIARSRG